MLKFTLDTNGVIDLEENRPNATFIRLLISAWQSKIIQLAVVAISASEKQPSGGYNSKFCEFEKKLAEVGLAGVECLLPMAYWDVAFWGHALWSAESMVALERKIHDVLFPNMDFDAPTEHDSTMQAWRNRKCDVQIAWAHIYHGYDVLVTSDQNFHRNADKLEALGLKKIASPEEAAHMIKELT